MTDFVKGQAVKFSDGRTGAVVNGNEKNGEILCVIDPELPGEPPIRGAVPTKSFPIADVKPITMREDSSQAAKRVLDVATADRDEK